MTNPVSRKYAEEWCKKEGLDHPFRDHGNERWLTTDDKGMLRDIQTYVVEYAIQQEGLGYLPLEEAIARLTERQEAQNKEARAAFMATLERVRRQQATP